MQIIYFLDMYLLFSLKKKKKKKKKKKPESLVSFGSKPSIETSPTTDVLGWFGSPTEDSAVLACHRYMIDQLLSIGFFE